MKKVLIVSWVAGIAAAGAGIGIAASSNSSSENSESLELSAYPKLEEKLKEIEKIEKGSDISSKVKELREVVNSIPENLLWNLEKEFQKWINKFKGNFPKNEAELMEVLNEFAQKAAEYKKKESEKEKDQEN